MTEETTTSLPSRRELRELVRQQLQVLLEAQDYQGAKAILVPVQPADIAEAIEGLPEAMQAIAFRLLSKAEAIDVYENLDSSVQQSLLEKFQRQEVIDIVDKMSPDDRARLFDELPAKIVRRVLDHMSPSERATTNLLLGYEPDSAGRIMTPEYLALKENYTVSESIERIRNLSHVSETVFYLYVTDSARRLTGIVSLRDLIIAQPNQKIADVMTSETVFVHTNTDQEEVARLIQRYDFLAVPVVDREERLVGIITVDDVIDILEQEATEDIYAFGGVQSDGDNYFQMSLWRVAQRRVMWLLILLGTNAVTGFIIQSQEELIVRYAVLSAFIPLLTGTGGNVGSQSSTVVIRGLNTDEFRSLGVPQVVFREGIAGSMLGATLGILATLGALFLLKVNLAVAIAVGISLLGISILASVAGSGLPFLFRSLGLDPALMSAPFITTAVDVLGVLIYFNIARFILNLGSEGVL
ncbi:magnesium transporter [Roseofilum capinflatum]|uniref:Magnesium transporter MgtE n=1 Tax=Roseofilum capinflatum BLCC-M114 TaxID=3022440 RepID=A0ABT7B2A2_9CYAN|nr:magnesium transporter [Roseofilum capinflatum]MDJ1173275.1 magnesium transporter [Roseofilum capinflatum BLCC-M114]